MNALFLAHTKQVEDATIDAWVAAATERFQVSVVPGRDDYLKRSRAMGGWNTWVKDVPVAEDWSGAPLFLGIVVPVVDFDQPSVGRATYALVEGFLCRGKPVYAWNHITNHIGHVIGLAEKQSDAWTDVGVLLIQESP